MTLKERVENLKWWHRIRLTDDIITPGTVDHSSDNIDQIENRFGLTNKVVEGKSVLDVGCWDGLFSFEAEKRGSKSVTSIDIEQNLESYGGEKCFQLAKEILNSKAVFKKESLFDHQGEYDVVLFYGVLYHLDDVFGAIKKLALLTKHTALIETAISNKNVDFPMMELKFDHDRDPTNRFYPNEAGLTIMLKTVGFTKIERLYIGDGRITLKATK